MDKPMTKADLLAAMEAGRRDWEALLATVGEERMCTPGVTADWSAAYTPNSGPMDAFVNLQFTEKRKHTAQEYAGLLREAATIRLRPIVMTSLAATFGLVPMAIKGGANVPLALRQA